MALTDIRVRTAKPRNKQYKLYDEKGLFLLIHPNQSRYWRFKYRFNSKEKTLAFGVYPEVTLQMARVKRDKARVLLDKRIDPGIQKQIDKGLAFETAANSFKQVGEEWFSKKCRNFSDGHNKRTQRLLEKDLYPWIGKLPISEITARTLLSALRRVESRGAHETAHRVKGIAGRIFRYGIAIGVCHRDITYDLKEALIPHVTKHRAAITESDEVGPFLKKLDGYKGTPVVRAALKLAPLTFVRPGELRKAKWSDIDLKKAEWRISAPGMKMRKDHIIPLSRQSLAVLKDIQPLTCSSEYVFPGARSSLRPMSDNGVLSALRNMDIPKDEMCGHGFRAMARTILDEVLDISPDWVEHQLAHAVRDVNGRAYNRTTHLEGRKKMMQAWADYLDKLKKK